jgi:hypothetical protein
VQLSVGPVEMVPVSQATQAVLPAFAYCPLEQGVQEPALPAEIVPGLQSVHVGAPVPEVPI